MKFNVTWNVCRVCLEEGDLCSIFDKDECNVLISEKIIECADVKIEPNTNLPEQICKKCLAYLNVAHKFRTICRKSDKTLASFLQNNVDTKEILNKYNEDEEIQQFKNEDEINVYDNSETDNSFFNNDESIDDVPLSQLLNMEQKNPEEDFIVKELESDKFRESVDTEKESPKNMKPQKNVKKTAKIITMEPDGTAVIQMEQIDDQRKKHICEICGNFYPKMQSLQNHRRWHRNEKLYCCEICAASFINNFQLLRHMRRHTGQKPYECKYCGRKFSDIGSKAKHERTHTGERPFKCETCGKTFSYSNVLNAHLMTHTGEKPFGCDQCGKQFSQPHHLKAHLKTQKHQNNSENS